MKKIYKLFLVGVLVTGIFDLGIFSSQQVKAVENETTGQSALPNEEMVSVLAAESTIHVTYYDADTGDVLKEFNVSGEVGTQFTDHFGELSAQFPTGYSLSPDPRTDYSPTFVEGEVGTASFYFTKDAPVESTIHVTYYDADTGDVLKEFNVSGEVGTQFTDHQDELTAQYPAGYSLSPDPRTEYSPTFVEGEVGNARFYFTKDTVAQAKINVEFYDQDTNKVIGNTEVSGEVGTTLNAKRSEVEAKYQSGYTLVSDNDSYNTEFVDGDSTTVRINFKKDEEQIPDEGKINVEFYDQDTNKVIGNTEVSGEVGTTLNAKRSEVEAKYPSGYTLVSDNDSYNTEFVDGDSTTVRLNFKKDPQPVPANGTIHIQFIDQTTKAILKEFDVSGTVGTTLAEYKKELENHFPTDYKLVSDADSYKLVFKSDEVGTAKLYFEKIKLAVPTINSVPGVQSSGQSSTYQRTNTLGNQPITSNTKNTSTTIPKLNDSKNSYLIVIGFLVLGGVLLLFKRNTRKNIH
ncbi:mucin-binding protein [Enterococcus sp. 22-H-5-01]|uniref:mucin-binding protein n=1 Tax=Enterococcus sp. 22-H-5-01 TaxID=3418555 RepID=UPI003D05CC7B